MNPAFATETCPQVFRVLCSYPMPDAPDPWRKLILLIIKLLQILEATIIRVFADANRAQ